MNFIHKILFVLIVTGSVYLGIYIKDLSTIPFGLIYGLVLLSISLACIYIECMNNQETILWNRINGIKNRIDRNLILKLIGTDSQTFGYLIIILNSITLVMVTLLVNLDKFFNSNQIYTQNLYLITIIFYIIITFTIWFINLYHENKKIRKILNVIEEHQEE